MIELIKKYKVFIILMVVFLLVFYLLFITNGGSYDDNVLDIKYSSKEVLTINNVLPITDAVGKDIDVQNNKEGITQYLEFEVNSVVDGRVKFEIYLTKNNVDSEIPDKFVKLYLTDQNDTPLKNFDNAAIPTYYDLKVSDIEPSGKLIYSGVLKNKESKKFKLRMWVADTYELTTDTKSFSAKLNVKVK